MTYQLSLTGHGASADDAIEAFENTVRALRKINAEGDGSMTAGQISGTDNTGNSFSRNASEVEDTDHLETDEVEEDDSETDEESETEGGTDPDA